MSDYSVIILLYISVMGLLLLSMSKGWIQFKPREENSEEKKKWYDDIDPKDF